jgi:hypothetical protein
MAKALPLFGGTHIVLGVDFCPGLDQPVHHLHKAVLRCDEQGRAPALRAKSEERPWAGRWLGATRPGANMGLQCAATARATWCEVNLSIGSLCDGYAGMYRVEILED